MMHGQTQIKFLKIVSYVRSYVHHVGRRLDEHAHCLQLSGWPLTGADAVQVIPRPN